MSRFVSSIVLLVALGIMSLQARADDPVEVPTNPGGPVAAAPDEVTAGTVAVAQNAGYADLTNIKGNITAANTTLKIQFYYWDTTANPNAWAVAGGSTSAPGLGAGAFTAAGPFSNLGKQPSGTKLRAQIWLERGGVTVGQVFVTNDVTVK